MALIRYPDCPPDASEEMRLAWGKLIQALEERDAKYNQLNRYHWVISNVSVNRTFDVSVASTSVASCAVAIGTLLSDLQKKSTIG